MSSRSRLLLLSEDPGLQLPAAQVIHADSHSPDARVLDMVSSTLGRLAGQIGSDPLPDPAWWSLPTIRQLSALWAARDALANPEVNEVLLASRSVQGMRELVEAPAVCKRLVDAAMTPRVAMWRGGGEPESAVPLFDSLATARQDLGQMLAMLEDPHTVARVPDWDVVACAQFGVLGVAVDSWRSWAPALSANSVDVVQTASGYDLLVQIPDWATSLVRLGRSGDNLVVAVDDVHRWLPLDPVVRRCHAIDAVVAADGLRIRFEPDSSQWRTSSEGST